ncbi:transcription factor bHLH95-like [Salvia divinorum]|uniref:Transcription factor bHLH95-like n=1 Tax=Salvia divinorum TaxID=28513 RepID=A0ABD1HNC7_SALDI
MAGDQVEHDSSLLWNDDQSWEFPVLPVEDNGGKILIESGKILTGVEQQMNDKGKKRAGNEADEHELHIWTERERRKKMRNMFASLQALIPKLHPRADKTTIVDEAVEHIQQLQQTLGALEKLKEKKLKGGSINLAACDIPGITGQSREAFMADHASTSQQPPPPVAQLNPHSGRASFTTWTSPNVVLNVCGIDAHISIACSPTKTGMMAYLGFMMNNHNLDLVSAHISSDSVMRNYMVHIRANGAGQQQLSEPSFHVEETYKQVAAELMLWINS